MNVQTYRASGGMVIATGGEFVSSADYRALEMNAEAENARLRAAISDCNRGLGLMAEKLVTVGNLLGFQPDESVADIAAKVRRQLPTRKSVTLAPDHGGMKMSAAGLLTRCARIVSGDPDDHAAGYGFALKDQLLKHLEELARRYYTGDASVVDEFLQLYCLGEDARKVAAGGKEGA